MQSFLKKICDCKEDLFCYRVITSPNYNWLVKEIVVKVRNQYKKYIEKIGKKNGCNTEEFKNLMSLAILLIKDYLIVDDKRSLLQLKLIIEQMRKIKK